MGAILGEFERLHPTLARLYARARPVFPSGVTHDSRRFVPFPLYVDHVAGSRKWDVDGNEIIDYVMGHGDLILGHAHPVVVDAIEQLSARGSHCGASNDPSHWTATCGTGRAGPVQRCRTLRQ